MMGIGMAVRPPRSRGPVLMMIDALRRIGGSLWMVDNAYTGAFVDNVGTTPVTAVGDLIGKVLDKTGTNHATQSAVASKPSVQRVPKRLGPNLVSNGGFDSGLTGWTRENTGTQTHESGAIRVVGDIAKTWSGSSQTTIPVLTRGKQYLVQFSVLAENTSSGAGLYFRTSSLAVGGLFANGLGYFYPSAVGNYSMLFTATMDDINQLRIIAGIESNSSVLFDNISVQEVLEWTNVISFDGSNDFLQTGITTGNEGWVCAGVSATSLAANMVLLSSGAQAGGNTGISLKIRSGGAVWAGRANASKGNTAVSASGAVAVNTPCVLDAEYTAAGASIRKDGTVIATSAVTVSDFASADPLHIGAVAGATHSEYLSATMSAIIYTPVLPSVADRATIRNGIAALQGRTL